MQVTQGGQQNSHPVSRVCGIHVSGTLCPHALLAANDDRRDGRDLPLRRWRLGVHHMLHDTCSQVRQIELTNSHTLCPPPTHPGSIVATRAASHHKTRMHAYTPLHPIPSLHFQYDNQYTGCEARAGDHDRHRSRPIRIAISISQAAALEHVRTHCNINSRVGPTKEREPARETREAPGVFFW